MKFSACILATVLCFTSAFVVDDTMKLNQAQAVLKTNNVKNYFREVGQEEAMKSLCDAADGVLGFLRPGIENWFDQQCLPQVSQQINGCKGDLQTQGTALVNQLCTVAADDLLTSVENFGGFLPQAIKDALKGFLGVGGPFISQCKVDAGAYVINEINQECAGVSGLNPVKVCGDAFQQIYQEVITKINSLC